MSRFIFNLFLVPMVLIGIVLIILGEIGENLLEWLEDTDMKVNF